MSIKPPLIDVHDLSFAYEGHQVLERVSFKIEKGDYVGIVGPNGGGKTTLLKILVGLLQAQSGAVKIDGIPIADCKKKFEIGYVPQRIAQDSVAFPATVSEVVESGLTAKIGIFHRLHASDQVAIQQALDMAHIGDLADRLMSELSGGQRQRVYVARALACQPRILILDEPFVGIDVTTQKEFYSFLRELNTHHALTILFVSHDVDIITDEVKSILCLNKGLMCFGKPSLLHEPHVMDDLYGGHITHLHKTT